MSDYLHEDCGLMGVYYGLQCANDVHRTTTVKLRPIHCRWNLAALDRKYRDHERGCVPEDGSGKVALLGGVVLGGQKHCEALAGVWDESCTPRTTSLPNISFTTETTN